jgi:Glycosyl hydrolase family 26
MSAETDCIRAMTFDRVWWFPLPTLLVVLLMAASSAVAATPRCSDRADNDGHGLGDPADPGCTSGTDDTELGNPPTHDWIFCVNEHEFCSFIGTREVRYGANGTFTEPRRFTDGVQCNNVTFGDPLPGVVKHCDTRPVTGEPPPPDDFPASYSTGPLGTRNILPASPGGALVSTWAGFHGATPQDAINQFQARQAAADRKIDVIATGYGAGGTGPNGVPNCTYMDNDPTVDWAIQNGSVPYISWTPGRSTVNGDSVIRQVINGQRDACIDAMAAHLDGKGVRIMLRPFHEFDYLQYHRRGDGSLDYTTEAAQGQSLIAAWRRVVARFQAAGATDVGFLWNPDEGGGSRSLVGLSYPGNTYVDWVGSDRYNHGPGAWSACDFFGWAEFWRIFNHNSTTHCGAQNYHDRFAVANGKPFFVGETSTRYDASVPDRKNHWYRDIAAAKDPADPRYMSNLIGVSIFDIFVAPEGNSNWRIDSCQTRAQYNQGNPGTNDPACGLNGWVQWVDDPRWKVGVAP